MIIVIRIAGRIGVEKSRKSTLESLMLNRKYSAILMHEKDLPVLKNIKELISFGELDDETLKELLIKRCKKGKKLLSNVDEVIKGLKSGKRLREVGVNHTLHLHPPRGGFKTSTKLPYPQGVLGKNKDIVKLVKQMI